MCSRYPSVSAFALSHIIPGIILFILAASAGAHPITPESAKERVIPSQTSLISRQVVEAYPTGSCGNFREAVVWAWKLAYAGRTAGGEESREIRPGGGPCEYRKYNGVCTITSVRQGGAQQQSSGIPYQGYEVLFSYRTDHKVEPYYGSLLNKEQTLTLRNSWPPGPRFLMKYGIEEGREFNCDLSVIVHGTCSPVQFDFHSIDLTDYFEMRPKSNR